MTDTPSAASFPLAERGRNDRQRSESRRRSEIVSVRMTPDERARFTALAGRKGVTLPNLMRLGVEAALLEEIIRG